MSGLSYLAVALEFTRDPPARFVLAAALGVLFVYSAVTKLRNLLLFALATVSLGVLSTPRKALVRSAVAAELALGVGLLLIPLVPSLGVALPVAATFALFVYTTVVLAALLRGRSVPCHCFGPTDTPISSVTLIRNVTLLGGSTALMTTRAYSSVSVNEWLLIVCTALASVGLTVALGALLESIRSARAAMRVLQPVRHPWPAAAGGT